MYSTPPRVARVAPATPDSVTLFKSPTKGTTEETDNIKPSILKGLGDLPLMFGTPKKAVRLFPQEVDLSDYDEFEALGTEVDEGSQKNIGTGGV
jgi:hypothetical protein